MIVNSGTEITGNSLVYGSQKPDRYKSRIADGRSRHLLRLFGGVEIRGTKWCGKTWAAMAAAESVIHLDNPNICLLYTSDAADDLLWVDLGGSRTYKKTHTTKS